MFSAFRILCDEFGLFLPNKYNSYRCLLKNMNNFLFRVFLLIAISIVPAFIIAQTKPRARDLGVPFEGTPGQFNAITDVKGVEVGYATLISGEGKTAVRTGVTAILPQGKDFKGRVFAGWHTLNGNGEMTGTTWVEESGGLGSPVLITNTHSVGIVRDAVIEWGVKKQAQGVYSGDLSLPVVAETWDGFLNDINGFHVKKEHVFQALEGAKSGLLAEGNVGGGTGMMAHGFKGGTGTASRKLSERDGNYTVGVLVQANYGSRQLFRIAGVPVGLEIKDLTPTQGKQPETGQGSIIVVVATDAPLLPHQLKRLAQRAGLGVAMMGGRGENSSGDIFIAFSTANAAEASKDQGLANLTMLPNERISRLFWATAQATEEAIVNAMIAAETMKGINGSTAYALPHDRLREVLKKYNRLTK
jgi:L-aminopeptidase/D-esterase-like protein